ncbi:MAG: cytochrome c3 family protein [Desulfobulbales bacterium]|nr:cytochrome c3 family protein [Desulfobulbales bacterium]
MTKKIVLCVAVLAMVCGFSAIGMAGGEGPETVTIDTAKKSGSTVTFQHWAHQGRAECADCHHSKNADGSQGPYVAGAEAACKTCHDGSIADKSVATAKKAAHKKCKGCHKEKNGPTKCGDCHKK